MVIEDPGFAWLEDHIDDTHLTERQRLVTDAIITSSIQEIEVEPMDDFGKLIMEIGKAEVAFTADQARHVVLVTDAVDSDWQEPALDFKNYVVLVAMMMDGETERTAEHNERHTFQLKR